MSTEATSTTAAPSADAKAATAASAAARPPHGRRGTCFCQVCRAIYSAKQLLQERLGWPEPVAYRAIQQSAMDLQTTMEEIAYRVQHWDWEADANARELLSPRAREWAEAAHKERRRRQTMRGNPPARKIE